MPTNEVATEMETLSLAPLSAGDLLDRIVRMYRRHWVALMRVAVLPVVLSYLGVMAVTAGIRNFSTTKGDLRLATASLLIAGGVALYLSSKAVIIFLLGGTARELVQYFMDGSPLTFMKYMSLCTSRRLTEVSIRPSRWGEAQSNTV